MNGFGWGTIARLGVVQAVLGGVVALCTSTLNRIMVVEYALPAMLPAALVALHYAVQLSRPLWGHGSDRGARRTPWIVGGVAVLAGGAVLAAYATTRMADARALALAMGLLAFVAIGGGVGAAGTSLLALLATGVAPARRAAAAATTWIMMIVGIVIVSGVLGRLLDPYSPARLLAVAGGVAAGGVALAAAAVWGVERRAPVAAPPAHGDFRAAVAQVWADRKARRFTLFVFTSMLAFSAQELILEPFSGLVFHLTPGQSASVFSLQHIGVLAGMIVAGAGGSAFGRRDEATLRRWTVIGCAGSACAAALIAVGASIGPGWPLRPTVLVLGFMNGVFAVSAIGSMMALAGAAGPGRAGVRMGLWGGAQAIAFAIGGFLGALGVDAGRRIFASNGEAFVWVFAAEGLVFLAAAAFAARVGHMQSTPQFTGELALGSRS